MHTYAIPTGFEGRAGAAGDLAGLATHGVLHANLRVRKQLQFVWFFGWWSGVVCVTVLVSWLGRGDSGVLLVIWPGLRPMGSYIFTCGCVTMDMFGCLDGR